MKSELATSILATHLPVIESALEALFHSQPDTPKTLLDAMKYSMLGGGKRFRPTLLIESYSCLAAGPVPASVLSTAVAVELIHTFSLIHDDLPAMDDDDLRRGKPTSHKVFGEAVAILAGDAMVPLAFEQICRNSEASIAGRLCLELALAAGGAGMVGGQVEDILTEDEPIGLDRLRNLHSMKTGALLRCCCRMGGILAGANSAQIQALDDFGSALGIGFQIADDLLDVTGTTEQIGKTAGKDAKRGKNTFVALLGVERSRIEAGQQLQLASGALERVGGDTTRLLALARFAIERNN
jgi:geranylgeranyl diphosphate synthase type II